ncbi:putative aldo-ketose reductase 1, partial [Operophtera brumata]
HEFNSADIPKMIEALSYAIDIGYRHVDTAHVYRVEPEVWQHFHREGDVEVGLRGSLRRLNLDYVDMVLMHWPFSVSINLNLGQKELVDYCQANQVIVTAYSPLGTMIPNRAVVDSPEPKLNNPTMVAIAKKHGKTYQRGLVMIPKTVTNARVLENASIFDFHLDAEDVATIAKFDVGYRTLVPLHYQDMENYPFDVLPGKSEPVPLALRKWKNGAKNDIE